MNKYHEMSDKIIYDNKNIIDLLYYDNYSHWWSIDTGIYRYFEESSSIDDNIPVRSLFSIIENILIIRLLYDLINYSFWKIINVLTKSNITARKTECNTLLYRFELIEWRETDDDNNNYYNVYNGDIVGCLPSSLQIITPYDTRIFNLKDFRAYNKIKKSDKRTIPCTYWKYWSWNVWKSEKKAILHFYKIWNNLSLDNKLLHCWDDIVGMNHDKFQRFIKKQILVSIQNIIGYSAIVENMIKKEHPSVMIMTDEQMPNGRAWVNIARKYGIPTIGIQHGVIAQHPAYLYHNPNDVSVSGKEMGKSFPVPDVTCVWGEAEYDLLVNKAGYPADQVVITGNPRYDYLGHASEMYSRDEFCKKYNINPENKIILWATQSHGWGMDENNAYFKEVFDTFSNLSGVTLIIKQHPGEGAIYRNLISQYIHDYDLKLQIIVPDKMSNTTEMVYVSDIIINKNSTTGQEAVSFHKPMIILDFSDKPDVGEYVKENVALPVYNKGILKEVIEDIINNGCNLNDAQDIYIKHHLYKIDGLASKRVADVIMQHIKHE